MKERIKTACVNISEQVLRKVKESFINHLEKCIEFDEHHRLIRLDLLTILKICDPIQKSSTTLKFRENKFEKN